MSAFLSIALITADENKTNQWLSKLIPIFKHNENCVAEIFTYIHVPVQNCYFMRSSQTITCVVTIFVAN
jgi:hypothetical protein